MKTPARILIADDDATNVDILRTRLSSHGYEILSACDGEEALSAVREQQPDLILLDIMMPKMDGIAVCRSLKNDETLPFMPVIMVSARTDSQDIVAALDAGADEYLTKPVDQTALVARVQSMLRIKQLHDTTCEQAVQLAEWNQHLEQRVAEQVEELGRVGQLKRFFSPQIAELIVSSKDSTLLEDHRNEITVLFADLRNFTAFSATAEPEEVMRVLRQYHDVVGPLILEFGATLDHFAGDGLMVFFNDPLPCPDAAVQATRLAVAMRDRVSELIQTWRKHGFDLGFGVGVASGYATLGQIGASGQFHYTAIGSVANLAARLCDAADDSQILISQGVFAEVENLVNADEVGELELKGFHKPVPVLNVRDFTARGSS